MNASASNGFSADISPDLSQIEGLSDMATELTSGSQSVSESLTALADNGLYQDAVTALSQGLEKDAAVSWAVESAKMVEEKLPAEETEALAAAQEWLASGGADSEQLATALEDNQMQGPGAWAALAADWAGKAQTAAAGEAPPVDKAVESSVKLSAALTKSDWPLAEPGAAADAMEAAAEGIGGKAADAGGAVSEAMDAAAPAAEAAAADTDSPEQALNDLLKPFVDLGMKIAHR